MEAGDARAEVCERLPVQRPRARAEQPRERTLAHSRIRRRRAWRPRGEPCSHAVGEHGGRAQERVAARLDPRARAARVPQPRVVAPCRRAAVVIDAPATTPRGMVCATRVGFRPAAAALRRLVGQTLHPGACAARAAVRVRLQVAADLRSRRAHRRGLSAEARARKDARAEARARRDARAPRRRTLDIRQARHDSRAGLQPASFAALIADALPASASVFSNFSTLFVFAAHSSFWWAIRGILFIEHFWALSSALFSSHVTAHTSQPQSASRAVGSPRAWHCGRRDHAAALCPPSHLPPRAVARLAQFLDVRMRPTISPYRPSASEKMSTSTMPTYSLGCSAAERTP